MSTCVRLHFEYYLSPPNVGKIGCLNIYLKGYLQLYKQMILFLVFLHNSGYVFFIRGICVRTLLQRLGLGYVSNSHSTVDSCKGSCSLLVNKESGHLRLRAPFSRLNFDRFRTQDRSKDKCLYFVSFTNFEMSQSVSKSILIIPCS